MRHRRAHALRRRYGRAKTFGKVPVGGLFQLKDDPDNAILKKVGKSQYMVITPGHPSRGIKFIASSKQVVKRGRQS
jgi:hypothetical protein